MKITIVKNKYLNALLLLMLVSAIAHMLILFYIFLATGDMYILNYFNILDVDLFFPDLFNTLPGNIFSALVAIAIYILILKLNTTDEI